MSLYDAQRQMKENLVVLEPFGTRDHLATALYNLSGAMLNIVNATLEQDERMRRMERLLEVIARKP
jgi:hypothetical protein